MEFCFLFSLGCEGSTAIIHLHYKTVETMQQKPRPHLLCQLSCSAALPPEVGRLGAHREVQGLAMAVSCCLRLPVRKICFTVNHSAGFSCVFHSHRAVRPLVL